MTDGGMAWAVNMEDSGTAMTDTTQVLTDMKL